jgi:hypothetical protein
MDLPSDALATRAYAGVELDPTGALLYRPQMMGHRDGAYAATVAVDSWSCRTTIGGLNPCRLMS